MVTSTLLSISSERNTVTHHVRASMALHHFTMLVNGDHAHIVQYLLSTGRVNPLTKDKYGDTALSFASGQL